MFAAFRRHKQKRDSSRDRGDDNKENIPPAALPLVPIAPEPPFKQPPPALQLVPAQPPFKQPPPPPVPATVTSSGSGSSGRYSHAETATSAGTQYSAPPAAPAGPPRERPAYLHVGTQPSPAPPRQRPPVEFQSPYHEPRRTVACGSSGKKRDRADSEAEEEAARRDYVQRQRQRALRQQQSEIAELKNHLRSLEREHTTRQHHIAHRLETRVETMEREAQALAMRNRQLHHQSRQLEEALHVIHREFDEDPDYYDTFVPRADLFGAQGRSRSHSPFGDPHSRPGRQPQGPHGRRPSDPREARDPRDARMPWTDADALEEEQYRQRMHWQQQQEQHLRQQHEEQERHRQLQRLQQQREYELRQREHHERGRRPSVGHAGPPAVEPLSGPPSRNASRSTTPVQHHPHYPPHAPPAIEYHAPPPHPLQQPQPPQPPRPEHPHLHPHRERPVEHPHFPQQHPQHPPPTGRRPSVGDAPPTGRAPFPQHQPTARDPSPAMQTGGRRQEARQLPFPQGPPLPPPDVALPVVVQPPLRILPPPAAVVAVPFAEPPYVRGPAPVGLPAGELVAPTRHASVDAAAPPVAYTTRIVYRMPAETVVPEAIGSTAHAVRPEPDAGYRWVVPAVARQETVQEEARFSTTTTVVARETMTMGSAVVPMELETSTNDDDVVAVPPPSPQPEPAPIPFGPPTTSGYRRSQSPATAPAAAPTTATVAEPQPVVIAPPPPAPAPALRGPTPVAWPRPAEAPQILTMPPAPPALPAVPTPVPAPQILTMPPPPPPAVPAPVAPAPVLAAQPEPMALDEPARHGPVLLAAVPITGDAPELIILRKPKSATASRSRSSSPAAVPADAPKRRLSSASVPESVASNASSRSRVSSKPAVPRFSGGSTASSTGRPTGRSSGFKSPFAEQMLATTRPTSAPPTPLVDAPHSAHLQLVPPPPQEPAQPLPVGMSPIFSDRRYVIEARHPEFVQVLPSNGEIDAPAHTGAGGRRSSSSSTPVKALQELSIDPAAAPAGGGRRGRSSSPHSLLRSDSGSDNGTPRSRSRSSMDQGERPQWRGPLDTKDGAMSEDARRRWEARKRIEAEQRRRAKQNSWRHGHPPSPGKGRCSTSSAEDKTGDRRRTKSPGDRREGNDRQSIASARSVGSVESTTFITTPDGPAASFEQNSTLVLDSRSGAKASVQRMDSGSRTAPPPQPVTDYPRRPSTFAKPLVL